MTAVGKLWLRVLVGVFAAALTMAVTIALKGAMSLGESILLRVMLGVMAGVASFNGVWALTDAIEEAGEADKQARDSYAAKVTAEYEKLMREEERKARG